MSTVYIELTKRQVRRKDINKQLQEILPPLITDEESVREHNKRIKEASSQYLDACFLIERDMDILLWIIREQLGFKDEKIGELVQKASEKVPLDPWVAERLAKIEELRAKEKGEVPGQMHLEDVEAPPEGDAEPTTVSAGKKPKEKKKS